MKIQDILNCNMLEFMEKFTKIIHCDLWFYEFGWLNWEPPHAPGRAGRRGKSGLPCLGCHPLDPTLDKRKKDG